VGVVSRGSEAKRNDLGERNPGAAEGGGAYTDLLDAVGRGFMLFLFLLKYFICFILPSVFYLFKDFYKIFLTRRCKLPDINYRTRFIQKNLPPSCRENPSG
jgi:hypothetical protein